MTPDGNGRVRVTEREREEIRPREGIRPIEEQVERTETRVMLMPIASPSILGFFAMGNASWVIGGFLAGWFSFPLTPTLLFPFLLAFGGIAQFLAGMWAFRARDNLGAYMFTMWGSFWFAFGLLTIFLSSGVLSTAALTGNELGMIFVTLAVASWIGTIASAWRNLSVLFAWAAAAVSATVLAVGSFGVSPGWVVSGGWALIVTAVLSWYAASARLLNTMSGHTLLPVGRLGVARRRPSLDAGLGEPGVMEGW